MTQCFHCSFKRTNLNSAVVCYAPLFTKLRVCVHIRLERRISEDVLPMYVMQHNLKITQDFKTNKFITMPKPKAYCILTAGTFPDYIF